MDFTDINYNNGFLSFLTGFVIYHIVNFATYYIVKKVKKWGDYSENSEEIEKNKKKVLDNVAYQKKIILQIKPYADINQNLEKSFGSKGLIIHFAYYGNSKNLKNLMSSINLMTKEELDIFCSDEENEVYDVTIPVQYLLKRESKNTYSSIFFYQVPKTQILGFTNPVFKKTSKKPSLLLK